MSAATPGAATSAARCVCLAAGLIATWLSSALADGSSLPYGGGGRIGVDEIVRKYNASGEIFRIEGRCQSSCTMLLQIKNACVDPDATLLFHAALFPNEKGQKPPPARQARMLNSYNAKLRSFLVANHYVDSFDFHAISGRDIIQKFGYRQCRPK
jgi:hypothetical protein